jgi:hypothetical protein
MSAPSHTDLMVSPEAIDNALDPRRIAANLRALADWLSQAPLEMRQEIHDLHVAADMLDGII